MQQVNITIYSEDIKAMKRQLGGIEIANTNFAKQLVHAIMLNRYVHSNTRPSRLESSDNKMIKL